MPKLKPAGPKVTFNMAEQIRLLRGKHSLSQLAKMFNISVAMVHSIMFLKTHTCIRIELDAKTRMKLHEKSEAGKISPEEFVRNLIKNACKLN